MRRSVLAVASLAVLAGCGGGSNPTTPGSATPAPSPTPIPSAVVVFDSTNFDARVLGAARPVLVEFHLPT